MNEPSALPPPHSGAIRVLLVDDQKMIGEVVRRILADQPEIEYHYCSEPAKAAALAQQLRPHVILQDLVMPGVTGEELVRLYRADPVTQATPIVILSAADDSGVQFEVLQAGANDFLVKLPNKAELIACIHRHARSRPPDGAGGGDGLTSAAFEK